MSTLQGIPDSFARVVDGAAEVTCDATLYPLDALYAATYCFLDRCWILVDRDVAGAHRVTLRPRTAEDLRSLVGSFANELLSCAARMEVVHRNQVIIEAVTTAAVSGALGAPSLDDLASFDFSDDGLEDPLGIAQSWEARYGGAPAGPGEDS